MLLTLSIGFEAGFFRRFGADGRRRSVWFVGRFLVRLTRREGRAVRAGPGRAGRTRRLITLRRFTRPSTGPVAPRLVDGGLIVPQLSDEAAEVARGGRLEPRLQGEGVAACPSSARRVRACASVRRPVRWAWRPSSFGNRPVKVRRGQAGFGSKRVES